VIELEYRLEIGRPVQVVFSFLADVRNLPRWSNVVRRVSRTDGPARLGAAADVEVSCLGQDLGARYEVTAYEPDRALSVETRSASFSMGTAYTLEPVEGGTRLAAKSWGEGRGLLGILEPLATSQIERQMRSDHDRLKEILERDPR
jgi:carbon monoxide dehydrogenase subunit G